MDTVAAKKKKAVIGLSGGVDSSVAAALLKEAGYDVSGVFLNMRGSEKEKEDVRMICTQLKIPLQIVEAAERFQKSVIRYFLDEYGKGKTPNPCVYCNENFKFRLLFEAAREIGADRVATGHYARLRQEIPNIKLQISNKFKISNSKISKNSTVKLYAAKDEGKDQSYFLYRLKQDGLKRVLFPLGEFQKDEVRKMARDFGLPVSGKKDSQDICFLGGMETEMFLRKELGTQKGDIVMPDGKIVGKHDGLYLFTQGQRKNINIGGDGPYYVSGKNFRKNELVVTNAKEDRLLFWESAELEKVNWISKKPKFPARLSVRTRYRNPLVYATIEPTTYNLQPTTLNITFEEPQRAVAPGQSCVFYGKDGEVIGGGIIK